MFRVLLPCVQMFYWLNCSYLIQLIPDKTRIHFLFHDTMLPKIASKPVRQRHPTFLLAEVKPKIKLSSKDISVNIDKTLETHSDLSALLSVQERYDFYHRLISSETTECLHPLATFYDNYHL